MNEPPFADLVLSTLGPLLHQHGFRMTDQDLWQAVFQNDVLRVDVTFDPRGEVDVSAARHCNATAGVWSNCGFVGRASIERVLELAGEQLADDPRVLAGDGDYFDELATTQAKAAAEWTAYHSGKGHRPRTGYLP